MERRLIIMRHAKSSWDSPADSDHQRPLNDRGCRATPLVARQLTELGWRPQHIISSDSKRTRQTASLLLDEWEEGIGVDFLPGLYLGGTSDLESELAGVSDEVETLLALGHNPGWEAVVFQLTGQGLTMKTATAALLRAGCESWSDTFRTPWHIEDVIHPRSLD